MIKFENLSVTYPGGVEALKDINLEINEGDFLIIVGLSGAGKSTLLRATNNLVKPTKGNVYVGEVAWTFWYSKKDPQPLGELVSLRKWIKK